MKKELTLIIRLILDTWTLDGPNDWFMISKDFPSLVSEGDGN